MKSAVSVRETTSDLPTLNLSRTPFQNRRLFWICWGLLALVGVATIVSIYRDIREEEAVATVTRQRVAREKKAVEDLKATLAKPLVTDLSPRDEHAVRSIVFLADQRGFSWSRLLTQLELSMSKDVRIIQVNWLENDREDDATRKRMSVTVRAGTPEAITKYLRELDRHRVFHFDARSQKQPDRQSGIAEVEFILDGYYRPGEPGLTPPAAAAEEDRNAPKALKTASATRGKGTR